MNPIPQLTPHLKQLRLSGILDSLEVRNRQAVEQKLAYTDFLALLIEDEIARREQRKLVMRQRRAGINTQKTLESYDFTFNLGVNQAQIMDLATCRYLEEKAPVLIVGPCGTGKSHLAQALGHIAVRRGYDTVFSSHAKLLGQLASARAVGTYERKLAALTKADLLIIVGVRLTMQMTGMCLQTSEIRVGMANQLSMSRYLALMPAFSARTIMGSISSCRFGHSLLAPPCAA
jgi:DNA replication protein DnaC